MLLQISLEWHEKVSEPFMLQFNFVLFIIFLQDIIFVSVTGTITSLLMNTFCLLAVPGEGVGHRVTQDDEKNKGRVGSQQHHESGEADPTSRLHMTL